MKMIPSIHTHEAPVTAWSEVLKMQEILHSTAGNYNHRPVSFWCLFSQGLEKEVETGGRGNFAPGSLPGVKNSECYERTNCFDCFIISAGWLTRFRIPLHSSIFVCGYRRTNTNFEPLAHCYKDCGYLVIPVNFSPKRPFSNSFFIILLWT